MNKDASRHVRSVTEELNQTIDRMRIREKEYLLEFLEDPAWKDVRKMLKAGPINIIPVGGFEVEADKPRRRVSKT
jgi:hypothetical protein